jgi:hypothetical protein
MTQWVRNAVMLAVTTVWAAVVLYGIAQKHWPDPVTWGVVPGVWVALHPSLRPRRATAVRAAPTDAETQE